MTNPSSDRLDRIENLVESNARAISSLVEVVTIHEENFAVVLNEIRDMKAEIRGLQTENRRMLDRLFGQGSDDQPQQ